MPVVLADDLTGACDVGAECLRNGWRVRVLFVSRPGWINVCLDHDREVVILDLETRRLRSRAAARRAGAVSRSLAAIGVAPAYFKIDSTLRGNVAAEAEAVRASGRRSIAWIVPANPGQGRTTVGGRQYVRGVPVERTPFSRDPIHPVSSGDVVAMMKAVVGSNGCVALSRRDLVRGAGHVERLRSEWIRGRVRAVVADAASEADLRKISGVVGPGDVPCGAASLARYVLRRRRRRGRAGTRRCGRPAGRWLAVIGSLNPVTREQVRRAVGRGGAVMRGVSPRDIAGSPGRIGRWAVETARAMAAGRWGVITLDVPAFRSHFRAGTSSLAAGERIARGLARHAAAVIARLKPGGLILSGGLTAASVCEEVGVRYLTLRREVVPGVVASEAVMGKPEGRTVRVITKPGGFGSADALVRIMRAGDGGA